MRLKQALAPLAITSGEPAGVGLDVCLGILGIDFGYPIEILVDLQALTERAEQVHQLETLSNCLKHKRNNITFRNISTNNKVIPGKLDVQNVPYVLNILDKAIKGIAEGIYAGIVTAPIHKGIINESGIPFTGHTEYFQQKAQVEKVVMMLSSDLMNVALVTTHIPLKRVASAISTQLIIDVVRIIHREFQIKFKISYPKIVVAALNPHAGENGYLGMEEIEIIAPALRRLQQENIKVSGPYSADSIFQREIIEHNDVILVMYHDQGLPVIKYSSFGHAVNVTLGLPYVRTSVDHGTALNLAGSGKANSSSLFQAIKMAKKMI